MPELPDVELYCGTIAERVLGEPVEKLRLASAFLLRSVDPPASEVIGRRVTAVRRLGKRLVLALEDDLFLVFHLMIAGRFRWEARGAELPARIGLGALDFPNGSLIVTEASKKKRASLHVVRGAEALAEHDPGGLEVLESDLAAFARALREENHTLKRALTDPRRFSGIGNAYSDEILHAARLSPIQQTKKLDDEEVARLYRATRETLVGWTERLREEFAGRFPGAGDVTAFRPDFAVHGRYRQPCPVCGDPVQRIRYADSETNYCATCQTGGRVLRDRALSRLLKDDWPDSLS
ncbi:MAG: formamidopyrimidine-DNA glycosylase [Deltaproteobacteria bacterium]|nr:formamidopyrimidine-DNA glycosylase [Deltaproteobacteria bacterium]